MYKLRIIHPNANNRLKLLPVMHGIVGVLFLVNAIGIYRGAQPNWFLATFFFLVGLASLLFPFTARKFKNFPAANIMARIVQVFICLTGSLYFLSHLAPTAAFMLIVIGAGLGYIAWSEYKVFQPAFMQLDKTGITVPTAFTPKVIGWNELNNVILRNDLLTLDFKSNKVLQLELVEMPAPEERDALNAFCKSRI
ncbi:hypothetical protein CLV59_104360 [Chitinophaga dinghuensis]|uniref:Uncharacterized protein n=1 Tax=Chitinophaga dinghuensis TaxID=1539050 RepID=A0A327W1K9_9BACT|nr:hypothetical protein [Chitinophaga dinghuensis]RAJ82135.1 hypothetical protein CLV59_104360 [Chitinophaga dinghuensis]